MLFGDSDDDSLGQEPSQPNCNVVKFSSDSNSTVKNMLKPKQLLAPEFHTLCDDFSNLVICSSSKQTWAKHCSAWKLYKEFCSSFGANFDLPIKLEYSRAFVTWATTKKGLKSSTVRAYVSSLNTAHVISNIASPNLSSDCCTKLALKGAQNLLDPTTSSRPMRLPMNLDLMIVLGHRIKGLNWGEYAKQVFWTACTTSFFSSCRMGEILAPSRNSFEPKSTLKWENVVVSSGNEILIFIPYSKTKGFKGKIVDL